VSPWRKRLLWIVVPVLLVAADQWTKALVRHNLERYDRIEVVEGFFRINHVQNKGAAFGLFSDMKDGDRELLLSTLGGIALLLVIVYSLRLPPGAWVSQLGLHMIFAGAVGNLIDRFTIGWVTDFLEVYWREWRWPAFNMADSVIVLGVCLLLADTFRPRRHEPEAEETVELSAAEGAGDALDANQAASEEGSDAF